MALLRVERGQVGERVGTGIGIEPGDARDGRDAAIDTASGDEDDEVDRLGDKLARHGNDRFLAELLDPIERGLSAVGVDRRDPARVPGVPSLEHVERLGAADFADDDPVGAESHRRAHQLGHRHVRRARAQRHRVGQRALQLARILDQDDAGSVHPVVASAARELLNKSDNERSGVLSTAMSFLSLYRDPTVAAVTAASDWRIADLIEAAHPVSLYLVVPPSDISRTKPLNRLFELGLGPIALALCGASNPATQKRINAVLAEHGRDGFASAFLRDAGLDWAADLMADAPQPEPGGASL